jgi:hypothetical protein
MCLQYPPRGSQYAFEIPRGAATAWKLLVAFRLRFGAICTRNGSSTGGFGYEQRGYFAVFWILAMDSIMPLEQVPRESAACLEL